ncbi:MAG: peptide MFS transporter [Polyangiaceae bacterium]|nr:peptide MFS transporter [Polyangiaceae bacterium]
MSQTEAAHAHHGHPRGLYTLFGAEAWERFSYYGMRALLVLYMVNALGMQRKDALEVYALYTSLVYLTPILGGWFADHVLGRRKAVLIGGIVMALGHLAMAFEPLLYTALGLLCVGNGFFKPNISTIVGGLYEENDPRRDGGFTIFYMGINLGAFFSPIVCGNLGEKVGWHWGFSAAAFGMVAGLVQFVHGQKYLGNVGLPPGAEGRASGVLDRKDYTDVAIWVAGSTALVVGLLQGWTFLGPIFAAIPSAVKLAIGVGLIGLTFAQLYKGSDRDEMQRITVIIVLSLFNIFFWMGFEQAGGTMTLFADKQTDRNLSGLGVLFAALAVGAGAFNIWKSTAEEKSGKALWRALVVLFGLTALGVAAFGAKLLAGGGTFELPASQFQSINPLLIVVLAPTFSRMWETLDSGRLATSTPTKMALGMIILGLGFVVMYVGQSLAASGAVSPLWLVTVYAVHTIGELCLSPIGLSMVTKLAPVRVVSLAMGLWFVSSAVANYLAGTLEARVEEYHWPIYGVLVVSSIGPAILLLALTPWLKRWMHGRG